MNEMTGSRVSEHAVETWSGDGLVSQSDALYSDLERGGVLLFPRLAFVLREDERRFLDPAWCREGRKHVSVRPGEPIRGAKASDADLVGLRARLERYAQSSRALVRRLLPSYEPHCVDISTSFRPAPIDRDPIGRRRDDTRLHV